MGKSLNILLGATATSLMAIGVAAQTGTVRWPTFDAGSGGVQAQHVTLRPSPSASPSPSTEPSPSPSPQPTQAPVVLAPAPPPAPHKKHKG